jgi:crotonobetainyl-CoA:carnitine CoA-transferase CaiB-like acyl-CoA transferase
VAGALDGLFVVELAGSQAGAPVGQLLADFGADVLLVEPPGGTPLRAVAGFPFWARGKSSAEIDLHSPAGIDALREVLTTADVFIETLRPGVLARLGLEPDALLEANPRLIHTSITGFGTHGPLRDLKGYEGLVMAKIGGFASFEGMIERDGPAFVSVPYCSFSAAQTALHGTLAALYERETSGRGQRVEASLVQGLAGHDTWQWYINVMTDKYPDALVPGPAFSPKRIPNSGFYFRLAVLLTADGRWLQFSQTFPRLFRAYIRVLGLEWMFDDAEWSALPDFLDEAKRVEFWERLIEAARTKTLAEWQQVFEQEPDVWGELFRHGRELLDHEQLVHDGQVVTLNDDEVGPVRQPGALVRMSATPAELRRGAPRSGMDGIQSRPAVDRAVRGEAPNGLPLAGVRVLELATMYAAPYASTLLSDLGAEIVKVEPLSGDLLRHVLPFPELAGMKVMQGKKSIAVDLGTPEGLQIVHDLAKESDLVLQSYRAGVAERLGIDAKTLHGLNPNLVYLNAPGYGVDGPCGHRPAFAPTIGAAAGLAMRNVGAGVAERPDLSMAEVRRDSVMLFTANSPTSAQADGFSALGACTALLLGLVARARGAGGQTMLTSMLNTVSHALGDDMVDYPGRPETPTADSELLGLGPLYRLYPAATGWVFLAAAAPDEWAALAAALPGGAELAGDVRFADAEAREKNGDALIELLAATFATRPAAEWEQLLTAVDVGCVEVERRLPERVLMEDLGRASGYVTDTEHPIYGEHPRLSALVRFSRSTTTAGPSCTAGQHTDDVLALAGRDAANIADLRARGVVA